MSNPNLELNNVITPFQEIEMSFAPGRKFRMRKSDLMFESWCQDNYGSVTNFFAILSKTVTDKENVDAKELTFAVVKAFFHLISRDDQVFIRDSVKIEDSRIDEDGNEIKLNLIDKLCIVTSAEDVGNMAIAIYVARGYANPNALTEEEKKKKKSKARRSK